ncbi:hypothetical protein BDV96DRAFT_674058 [Lophiotrema nucula]|uniref:Gal80p-like C-terminal domain-containing protein n=1 Tax=Lophiotrema nucula TaxID=690887 RepID=A0A6A5ZKV0_9PLEO|nr:hypothetical protein BDV96DRAFT_674058 [Lophiotrema nucula]
MYAYGMGCEPKNPEHMLYGIDEGNGATLVSIPMGHAVDALCHVLGEVETLNALIKNFIPETTLVDKQAKKLVRSRRRRTIMSPSAALL